MKRRLFVLAVLIFFFSILLFPGAAFAGASRGILLWFDTVLPTLLPFMIAAGLMVRTNAVDLLSRLTGPVPGRILHVSPCGSFAVTAGFLCGYPMGAKVTADLLRQGRISREEAGYLLSFTNNISPMFAVSYVALRFMPDPSFAGPSILLLFLAPLLSSRLFYQCRKGQLKKRRDSPHPERGRPFSAGVVDASMMDGFDAIARVGGYMMLFSILTEMAGLLPGSRALPARCASAFLEMTSGVEMLYSLPAPAGLRWILIMSLCSSGGLCAAAQTYSMIHGTGLRISVYMAEKLATAGVTSLLCIVYLYVLR
ncbi:transporter [Mordavella massiliensis]|uniref:Transporter n=1 Tax=Mordavella massiliensis TaxID=1871024 RepID=A0A938X8L5_9CLOT|nr:transporter [Mordavella massiliensis]MBM6947475.1 transporter [Mordavella massiliensis]